MNNVVFWKTMENVRKHRDIKLVTTERRRNYLVWEPNYQTTKFFTKYLLAIEMTKAKTLLNKPVYLGLSVLELNKILTCEFGYDYLKPKYGEEATFCYMDIDSFIIYMKTDDIYKDIVEDVKTRLDTLWITNYEFSRPLDRPLPKGKKKKVIGLMKDELGGEKCVIKRKLKFENYINYLESTQIDNKRNYSEKK